MKKEYKPGDFLKATQVAEILNVTPSHVYKLIQLGKLRSFKSGKARRVLRSDVINYINSIECEANV